MLGDQPLVVFIPVKSMDAAESFYVDVLGLHVNDRSPFAVVMDAGGTTLRLAQVKDFQPQPFTVAGWRVRDINASIDDLASKGVHFIRYEGMDQDEMGVWSTPNGDHVAWFSDPDGNVLSLTSFAQ